MDPFQLGDATRRRRVYIILVHKKVLRDDIGSADKLEKVLASTIESMKVLGNPPLRCFVCNKWLVFQ